MDSSETAISTALADSASLEATRNDRLRHHVLALRHAG